MFIKHTFLAIIYYFLFITSFLLMISVLKRIQLVQLVLNKHTFLASSFFFFFFFFFFFLLLLLLFVLLLFIYFCLKSITCHSLTYFSLETPEG